MKTLRGGSLLLGGLLAVLLILAVALGSGTGPGGASSLSRGPDGWFVARAYLEERGASVHTLRKPLGEAAPEGVLVVSGGPIDFSQSDRAALGTFLDRGGKVVWAFGRGDFEATLGRQLGFPFSRCAEAPSSISPAAYRREGLGVAHPTAAGGEALLRPLRLCPQRREGDEVLVRTAAGEAVAIIRKKGQGEIALVPAELFANGRLYNRGNSQAFEALRARFDATRWTFDEFHNGLTEGPSPEGRRAQRGFYLFLAQAALAYAAFVWAAARSFGPRWPQEAPLSGATSGFLRAVASLHDRLGHHAEAAHFLRTRARDILGVTVAAPDPGLRGDERLRRTAAAIQSEHERRSRE